MLKDNYLLELNDRLRSLPPHERHEIISDYQEHFRAGSEEGLSDEEIIVKLGSPSSIAKQFLSEYSNEIRYQSYELSRSSAGKNVLALIALIFFNLVFVLGPALGLFGVYIGLFGASIGLFFGGIGMVKASITGFFPFYVNVPFMLPFIHRSPFIASIFGIGLSALGVLCFIGLIYLGKFLLQLVRRYFDWNFSIINGR